MEQAGLAPRKPERLEFMYDPGYGVSFQNQDQRANANAGGVGSSNNKKQNQSFPGALFDDKTHFANDSWRKSHSDPLLLIRKREQEAQKSVKGKRKDKDGETNEEDKRKHRRIV
ncbi:unnamed protein product [Arabis nemorensis]|uniref:Uncharacterized protein n=1 Tax=Arabis nemorensis TaxID=586526 RepID=A0A565BPQ8_9BRAS|nr:unnamed protein product [Arabis nemorensis]